MSGHIRVTPSILNADFDHLDQEIAKIASVSDYIHLDVMDNIFVPNFTFDFAAASKIIAGSPIPIDAHLMVADVDSIAIDYAVLGAASVTIHAEATADISSTLKGIKSHGARAALAVKPGTAIDQYSEFLDDVDMFLIMTVEPGFGGQKFIEHTYSKVANLKKLLLQTGSNALIEVDGGVSDQNARRLVEAGADILVAGSFVFNSSDPIETISNLKALR